MNRLHREWALGRRRLIADNQERIIAEFSGYYELIRTALSPETNTFASQGNHDTYIDQDRERELKDGSSGAGHPGIRRPADQASNEIKYW